MSSQEFFRCPYLCHSRGCSNRRPYRPVQYGTKWSYLFFLQIKILLQFNQSKPKDTLKYTFGTHSFFLPSEGRGHWFESSRVRHITPQRFRFIHTLIAAALVCKPQSHFLHATAPFVEKLPLGLRQIQSLPIRTEHSATEAHSVPANNS